MRGINPASHRVPTLSSGISDSTSFIHSSTRGTNPVSHRAPTLISGFIASTLLIIAYKGQLCPVIIIIIIIFLTIIRCMCVIVVTMRGWEGLSISACGCFLAKISSHRPTCKTTFARLTQSHSQAISQSFHVFLTFRSMRDTTFSHFSKLFFCTKLPFPVP